MDLRNVPLAWAPSLLMVDKPGKIGPGDDEVDAGDTVVDGLLHLMEQARQDVLIVSPYFVPGAPMMELFGRMRGQGRAHPRADQLAGVQRRAGRARRLRPLPQGPAGAGRRAVRNARRPGGHRRRGMGSTARLRLGPAAGGSKSGASRASLHSKAVILDQRLAVIGSMNLDLRSQLQNSEVALVIRSRAVSRRSGIA